MVQAVANIALIVFGGTSAAATAAALIFARVFVYSAVQLALNAASRALTPKPPKGAGRGMELTYSETDAPGVILYGRARLGGMNVIPALTGGPNNQDLHQVLLHGFGPFHAIGDVYFDDELIRSEDIGAVTGTLTDGEVTGASKYASWARIRRRLGTTTQTVDYILKNALSSTAFTDDFRGRGLAHTDVMFIYKDSVYSSVPLVNVIAMGLPLYDARLDSTKAGGSGAHRESDPTTWEFGSNVANALAHYIRNGVYGGGYPSIEIDWPSVMLAANACDAAVQIPDPFNLPAANATVNASLSNYVITKTAGGSAWNASVRSTSSETPSERPYVAATGVSGVAVGLTTDPTASDSYDTIDYSWLFGGSNIQVYENGTPVAASLRTLKPGGIARIECNGTHIHYYYDDELVRTVALASTTAALYFDSSLYAVGDSATLYVGHRYTCNGILLATDDFPSNVARLTDAMLGRIIYRDGMWRMYAGGWATPTFTVNREDFTGPVSIQFEGGREARYNRTRCWYVDAARKYARSECFPRYSNTYKTADGEESIDLQMEQPLCTNEPEAQRKAEFMLKQSRNQIIVSAEVGPKHTNIALWETGVINWDEFAWSSKTFRCVGCELSPSGGYRLTFREEQEADWDDLTRDAYNQPSTATLPVTNQTTPSTPPSFSVSNNINGTLGFVIGQPVVRPVGTAYQIIRTLTSTNAAVGTVIYDGLTNVVDLVCPTSQHWYFARAYVGSYFSGYQPNTLGHAATAGLLDTFQINTNAATEIVAGFVTGPNTAATFAGVYAITAVPPVPFYSTVNLTIAAVIRKLTAGGVHQVRLSLVVNSDGLTGGVAGDQYLIANSLDQLYTLQHVFTAYTNTTQWAVLRWDQNSATPQAVAQNINTKIEIIKR